MNLPSPARKRTGPLLLTMLLVALAGSGIPLAEVHAHDDATAGHAHTTHERSHDAHEAPTETAAKDGDATSNGSLHAHGIDGSGTGLTATCCVALADSPPGSRIAAPLAAAVPEDPGPPLFRPPIA